MIRPISPTRPPAGVDAGSRPNSAPEPRSHAQPRPGRRAARRAPKPVFLDRSGRRRRLVVASGAAAGVLVLLALTMLVAGLFGASPLPLPGLPDLGGPATTAPAADQPPDQAEPTSAAAEPQPSPTASDPAGPALPTNANQTAPPRHIPTQTPPDPGRPTKT